MPTNRPVRQLRQRKRALKRSTILYKRRRLAIRDASPSLFIKMVSRYLIHANRQINVGERGVGEGGGSAGIRRVSPVSLLARECRYMVDLRVVDFRVAVCYSSQCRGDDRAIEKSYHFIFLRVRGIREKRENKRVAASSFSVEICRAPV